ncbi:MAG: ABC transporter substrate-binding protein [Thermoprotei archaeon]
MSSNKSKKKTIAVAAIAILVLAIAGYAVYQRQSANVKVVKIGPTTPSTLVDISAAIPDALDPNTGFMVLDEPLFAAVYQSFIAFNGSSQSQFIPVLATSWKEEPNGSTYVFIMRPNTYFSNGDPINATTAWYSMARCIIIAQAPGVADYAGLIANYEGSYFLPVGIRHALQYALGLSSLPTPEQAANDLAYVLNHFNAHNQTVEALMGYRNQSIVVLNSTAFEFNLITPYPWFLSDLAAGADFWSAFSDPAFVSAHGGVQVAQPNGYIDENGMIGSGPYEIVSVGSGISSVTLKANPDYWAAKAVGIPSQIAPAKIPNVVIYYGVSQSDRIAEFDSGEAQIANGIPISSFTSLYEGYQYKQYVPFNAIMLNEGMQPFVMFLSLNTQVFPTNITDFRLAIAHAINYSEIITALYTYNGTKLGGMYLGPIPPSMPYYDPGGLKPYSFNISLAERYINASGWQGKFYVVLPNGTELGDPQGEKLPNLGLYVGAPLQPATATEMEIVQKGLSEIGITATITPVTHAVSRTWTTASATPPIRFVGWAPDWPDPIYQQAMVLTSPLFYDAGNFAWFNDSALNSIYSWLPWSNNSTKVEQGIKQLYTIVYNQAPYAWLPVGDTYMFVQPYLHGFVYNPYSGYYYSMMYYANYTAKT